MAQKRKPDQTKLIVEAALSLADKAGWDGLSLDAVAKKAKLKPVAVRQRFPDTWAILRQALAALDADTAKAVGKISGAWRDALFDILMTRFDLMQPHRAAYAAILPDLLRHPKTAGHFAKPFYGDMQSMLRLAKAPATPLHAAALGALYLWTAETWKNDDSADLSKTMAAVDKGLGYFEKAAEKLPLEDWCRGR